MQLVVRRLSHASICRHTLCEPFGRHRALVSTYGKRHVRNFEIRRVWADSSSTKPETASTLRRLDIPPLRDSREEDSIPEQVSTSASFEELRYEADVTNPLRKDWQPPRLVDQDLHRHNIQLWIQLLRIRARLDREQGVRDIWDGMGYRHVDLPTKGDRAQILWTAFHANIPLYKLYQHAQDLFKRTGASYQGLHTLILKPMLKNHSRLAMLWSQRLQTLNIGGERSLALLIDEALTSSNSLAVFRKMYVRQTGCSLYDEILPALCQKGMFDEALDWHCFLISVDDLPSRARLAEPLWCFFRWHSNRDISRDIVRAFVDRGISLHGTLMEHEIQEDNEPNTDEDPMIFVPGESYGHSFGVAPARLSDSYAARAFATKTFGLSIITSWLTAFGLETLGPLAMRELAVRCSTPKEVAERIQTIEGKRVVISNCIYSRLIRKLARDNNQSMLHNVLHSDMHPDVYDDKETQIRLRRSYMTQRDWPQLYRTLLVLITFHREPAEKAWNTLLHGYLQAKNRTMIVTTLDDMLSQGIMVSPITIKHSFYLLLPFRNLGKRPQKFPGAMDDLAFLTNMWLRILRAGGQVPSAAWRQVTNSYGMEGRMRELEDLSIWLAHHYGKSSSGKYFIYPSPARITPQLSTRHRVDNSRTRLAATDHNPLRRLFPTVRLSSIIEWGFKTLGRPVPKRSRPTSIRLIGARLVDVEPARQYDHWSRGLKLLSVLKRAGVLIPRGLVRKACTLRFRILFGGRTSSKKENRIAASNNPFTLAHMVKEANRLWDGRLFAVPVHVLRDDFALRTMLLGNGARLNKSRLLRRPMRKRSAYLSGENQRRLRSG